MSRPQRDRSDMCPSDPKIQRGATFSPCRRYRYALWRTWNAAGGTILFIGLNPSTADEQRDDPTIRRAIGFARRWGYGGVTFCNLFAWRATEPARLKEAAKPFGPHNLRSVMRLAGRADRVVAAWGNHGSYQDGDAKIISRLGELHCLGVTQLGQPRHPLYVGSDTRLVRFVPRPADAA